MTHSKTQPKLERIDSDGTLNGAVVPLEEISTVCLATDMGEKNPSPDSALFDLAYSTPGFSDAAFLSLDTATFAALSELAGLRWRQDNFDSAEFRRAFARDVVSQGFQRSHSVQVVPLTENEDQTWLTGTFALSNIRLQRPDGIATLTLHPIGDQSDAWATLANLVAQFTGTQSVNLPSGNWYHVKCNMDLTIDDGLAW